MHLPEFFCPRTCDKHSYFSGFLCRQTCDKHPHLSVFLCPWISDEHSHFSGFLCQRTCDKHPHFSGFYTCRVSMSMNPWYTSVLVSVSMSTDLCHKSITFQGYYVHLCQWTPYRHRLLSHNPLQKSPLVRFLCPQTADKNIISLSVCISFHWIP